MAATNTSNKTPKINPVKLIEKLEADYSAFTFKPGKDDQWSPQSNTIYYNQNQPAIRLIYGILHELAHAQLSHDNYKSDFELLKLETAAWDLAAKIGANYGIKLDENHIQNCLDTYRDWLHRRSTCPTCGTHVLQEDLSSYHCFNCQSNWQVTSGHFARAYRRSLP